MRTHSLLRCCFGIIVLHLAIIFSLLYPPSNSGNLWQMIFPSWSDLLQGGLPLMLCALAFGALVFPPLASWVASRFPTWMISLLGLGISLALSLAACLYFSGLFWSPPLLYACGSSSQSSVVVSSSGCSELHLLLAGLLFRIPFFGFGLSSILCFVLAIRLPLIRTSEQVFLRMSVRDVLVSIGEASRERSSFSEGETRPLRTGKDFRLLLFASLGLLCHLLIFLSLFHTYIDYYNPYGDAVAPTATTGWQLLAQAFQLQTAPRAAIMPPLPAPLALVLLSTMILPALIYLICLVLWPFTSELKDTGIRKSVSVCFLLNLLGLSLSSLYAVFSVLSHGGDLHDPVQNTHPAFGIPPIAFLFSLACSYVLVNHFRLRSGPGEIGPSS
jgi:hypothetical protein